MGIEERVLRLENAFTTLGELAARAHEKEIRQDTRLNDLSESNRLLVEMIRRHDERIDEVRAAQGESEQKLAALVDAQMRAEDSIGELKSAIAALVDAQVRTEVSLSRGMEELRAAQRETEQKIAALLEAHIRTEDALARLTEKVNDILQNGRNGQSQT